MKHHPQVHLEMFSTNLNQISGPLRVIAISGRRRQKKHLRPHLCLSLKSEINFSFSKKYFTLRYLY